MKEQISVKKRFEIESKLIQQKMEKEGEKSQEVKLQKYKITPFSGDFKHWLYFWNHFTVQGKAKDCILGLPHTAEGYAEAEKILELNFGKHLKVHKALIQELHDV